MYFCKFSVSNSTNILETPELSFTTPTVTEIEGVAEERLRIYPNPAKDRVIIAPRVAGNIFDYQITDLVGQIFG